jgi:hypothetical protein
MSAVPVAGVPAPGHELGTTLQRVPRGSAPEAVQAKAIGLSPVSSELPWQFPLLSLVVAGCVPIPIQVMVGDEQPDPPPPHDELPYVDASGSVADTQFDMRAPSGQEKPHLPCVPPNPESSSVAKHEGAVGSGAAVVAEGTKTLARRSSSTGIVRVMGRPLRILRKNQHAETLHRYAALMTHRCSHGSLVAFWVTGAVAGRKYRNIRLPEPLVGKVEAFLEGPGAELGFQSVPEVVKHSIRAYLDSTGFMQATRNAASSSRSR